MWPFDAARGCFEAQADTPAVCVSTSVPCTPAASLGTVCAFDPQGHLFLAELRGDEDLTGTGWRFTTTRTGYGPSLPTAMRATADEEARCQATACVSACPGVPPVVLRPHAGCAADAGGTDVSGD